MTTIQEFYDAFESSYDDVRENASKYLLRLTNYPFKENSLAWVVNKLNDKNVQVRQNVCTFIINYARNHDLGYAWINLARFLRHDDPNVRRAVMKTFSYVNKGEDFLKSFIHNSKFSEYDRFYVAEALEHYYASQKYFSSLNDLLKSKEPIVVKGAFRGIQLDSSPNSGILTQKDLMPLQSTIKFAKDSLTAKPKKNLQERALPREIQMQKLRDRARQQHA